MSATVGECQCASTYISIDVKDYVRYKIDDLPFTTARKINHSRCSICNHGVGLDTNKEFLADLNKNRAFVLAQDALYSTPDGTPIIPIIGYTPSDGYVAPSQPKQWYNGRINYLRFVQTTDKIIIKPASHPFSVYCNDADVLSIAAAQFVKPNDYFKLTSVERDYSQTRLSSSSHLPEMRSLD